MDQAFSSPPLRNRIDLPPGSCSNGIRGQNEEDIPREFAFSPSSETLCCRQVELTTNFLRETAFPPPHLQSFLIKRSPLRFPSRVLKVGTNNRLPGRPFSGRVISSAGASVKVGAGLSGAAIHRVVRGGGQEFFAHGRRNSRDLPQLILPQPGTIPTASPTATLLCASPVLNTEYARFFVFDWDNTLCPTEWLCDLYARSGLNLYLSKRPCQALNSPAAKPKIEQLQQHVRKLLLKCREKGEVAIMSNATTIGLVRTLRVLPLIQKTIDELHIKVISARDMCEPHGLPLEDWKDTALTHMLLDFAGRHIHEKLSVMTIGDQDFEHVALLNASEYLQRQFGRDTHPKCIKYVESPSLDVVIKQTTMFIDLLDKVSDEEAGTYVMDQDGGVWRP